MLHLSKFMLYSCWMTEGPPTMVCFLSCFYWVPLTDLGKFNQQTPHNTQLSRLKRSLTRSYHALCNKNNKKNNTKNSYNWFPSLTYFKMTFSCIQWQLKLTDYTRDTNSIKGDWKGNWLAVEAICKKDQMLMKRWGVCKLLLCCLLRMETPPVDCWLQQWSHVLAMTFCNPIDNWCLKKWHGWSAFLLHCES